MCALGGVRKEPGDKRIRLNDIKSLLSKLRGPVVTEIVGHGDETQAGDVGVVAGLVELLLGCVVTGEALGGF